MNDVTFKIYRIAAHNMIFKMCDLEIDLQHYFHFYELSMDLYPHNK